MFFLLSFSVFLFLAPAGALPDGEKKGGDGAPRPLFDLGPAERALEAGDSRRLAKAARALFDEVGRVRRSPGPSPEETSKRRQCLRYVEINAWSLARAAQRGLPRAELEVEFLKLQDASESCGMVDDRLESFADVDRALERAETKVSDLRRLASHRERYSETFTVEGLVRDIDEGRFDIPFLERVRNNVGLDITHYYQHLAYVSGGPEHCDKAGGVDKLYPQWSRSLSKSGGWGCREWYNEQSFGRAMLLRGPDLAESCRRYLSLGHREMSAEDVGVICGIIAQNAGDSKALCAKLVPRYLGDKKVETCVSEFDRYDISGAEDPCRYVEGGPTPCIQRCRDYIAFKKAYAAKKPTLCADSELCWAYMGGWSQKYVAQYTATIKDGLLRTIREAAGAERGRLQSLLERGEEFIAAAELKGAGAGAEALSRIESRRRRLSELKERARGLSAAGGGEAAEGKLWTSR